jgi:hypothetical protein
VYEVGTCDKVVYNNVLSLREEHPDLLEDLKDDLSKKPFTPIKGKYFLMQQYDAWEYRFNFKNRVYLLVDSDRRRVCIYGAGTHPKEKVPKPPKVENIAWSKFMVI